MTLHEWAARWQIPRECFNDLLGSAVPLALGWDQPVASESRVQSLVRIEAAQHGVHLFRNNVGAGVTIDPDKLCERCRPHGQWIRWGLANDSKRVNDTVKSADLIGFDSRGRFVSRECKDGDWKWRGTARELAQLNWANLVNAHGGDAKIVNGPGSFNAV